MLKVTFESDLPEVVCLNCCFFFLSLIRAFFKSHVIQLGLCGLVARQLFDL